MKSIRQNGVVEIVWKFYNEIGKRILRGMKVGIGKRNVMLKK